MSYFPLELSGPPLEIGRKRGRLFRDLIRSIAETRLAKITGTKREKHLDIAIKIEGVLQGTYPELVEELKGMAEGSGISHQDMLMLNAWWDNPIYCSNVALTKTSQGPILGSTLDIGRSPYLAMMLFKPQRGYSFVNVCSPDMIGVTRAMNEKGLCLGGSSISATDRGMGFPRYTLYRVVIQYCSTVEEGLRIFKKFKEGYVNPANILLIDAQGDAAVVEQTNTDLAVRRPENGGIACTNHYVEEKTKSFQPEMKAQQLMLLENSKARYGKFMEFIKTADRERAVDSVKEILCSHGDGGICQHGGEGMLHATTAFIMLPRARELYVSQPPGFYCQSQFIKYRPFA